MANSGPAANPDRSLKDASEIQWYNDTDDTEPMHPPAAPPSLQRVATLDSFVKKTPPAQFIAGSRRSSRTTRPSTKVTDPDNIALKRKTSIGTSTNSTRRLRICISDSDGEEAATEPDATEPDAMELDADKKTDSTASDAEDTDHENDYSQTKALGDQDRDVSIHFLSKTLA
jgi:hypothetical protein